MEHAAVRESPTPPRPLPRWPLGLSAAGLLLPFPLAAVWPAGRLEVSLLALLALGTGSVVAFALATLHLRRLMWRHAFVYMALPLCLACAVLMPAQMRHFLWHSSDLLRLRLNQHAYEAEIARLPIGTDRYLEVDWSEGLLFGDTFLIYDERDLITSPSSADAHPAGVVSEKCAGSVELLYGHYYLCNF